MLPCVGGHVEKAICSFQGVIGHPKSFGYAAKGTAGETEGTARCSGTIDIIKEAEIDHLDYAMLLMNIVCDMELARPRRIYIRTFAHGELKRMIIQILKHAGQPITTRQVTDEVRKRKQLVLDYRRYVKNALGRYKVTIKVGENEAGESLWTLKGYAAKTKPAPPRLRLV